MNDTIFTEGFEAYNRDEAADTNPYDPTQPSHEEWHSGWLAGEEAEDDL